MHLEKFDLNLLVAIEALMRHRNVTTASAELLITQSALSSALNRARQHFGDKILYYDGQQMVPTPFGAELENLVPEMIAQLRALTRMRAQTDLTQTKRRFTIVASDYVAAVYVSALSKVLAQRAPGVSLSVVPFTQESISMFQRGVVEFFIAPGFAANDDYEAELLFEDTFQCVLCSDNPVLRSGLDAKTFFSSPHVVTDFFVMDGKSHFERWLDEQGREIKVAASLPNFVVLPYYIPGTRNIATVHKRLVPFFENIPGMTFLNPPVTVPPLQEYLVTNYKQQHDPETRMLRDLMMEVGRDL
ncbi:LysR family transcriptional regulator [Thalassovita sp.]|jgi:LysR family nod box-dependent transcriptional activator|uniref:LysR family transcriptional regulator n=1 Tax=Thalassovita sp. TaxID=1979401 RepID=UPI003B5ADC1D